MTLKVVNNSDPGTADTVGGNDWDQLVGTVETPTSATNTIYVVGSTYKLKNGITQEVTTSSTLPTLVQTALDAKGIIYWLDGTYLLQGSGFAGWSISSDTRLFISPNAQIQPANDYTGYMFKGVDNLNNFYMEGGKFIEGGGTPDANWDLIWLEASNTTTVNAGIYKNTFRNVYCKRASSMIHLESNGSVGWINGNWFENMWGDYCKTPILFEQTASFVDGTNGMNRNAFISCVVQADSAVTPVTIMTTGIKDISGRGNAFSHCKVWDTTSGNSDSNITANATDTLIVGGMMTRMPSAWQSTNDLGVNTMILDGFNGMKLTKASVQYNDLSKSNTNYTLLPTDTVVRCDATSGSGMTITLPTAVGKTGKIYVIRRVDNLATTNIVTVATTSSQTISGAPATYLVGGQALTVESDGANWQTIGNIQLPSMLVKGSTDNRRAQVCGAAPYQSLTNANASTTSAIDTLWALAFLVPVTTKFDTITFRVATVGTAGSVGRVGIYRDNGNGYPGARMFDSGSIATDSGTGAKDSTITAGIQVFPPGLYWGAIQFGTAGPTVRTISGTAGLLSTMGVDSGGGSATFGYGYSIAVTGTAALPDPYTAGGTVLTTAPAAAAPIPVISLRAI